ncbi:MAG: endonuclease MutS2 [Clostridia bacterium]|nr:endonuclease MutS2 [Clostridia bacterium]
MDYSFKRHAKVLELDIVLNRLSNEAISPDAKEGLNNLAPSNDFNEVKNLLGETESAYLLMSKFSPPSFYANAEIPSVIARCKLKSTLSVHELLCVLEQLRVVRGASQWRSDCQGVGDIPIDKYFSMLYANKHIEDRINSVIKSEDEIYDKASSALYDIRRKKSACSLKVKDILEKIIRGAMSKYLQETIVTQRDGRYVVPVKVEHKSEVAGIVHDTSSTGSTVFIEPMSVVEANNEMRVLELKEAEEIDRILTELSLEVADFADTIKKSYEGIIALDMIFAKARYAYKIGASMPSLNTDGEIFLKRARHPLLAQKKAVPVTVGVGKDYDTLVITGPNTGGKTVTLKTVGLFCLMTMCGLMIPVDDGSKIAVFDRVFADIGDEQSIEQSLSTFSSHMVNLVKTLNECNGNSLVLLDELCAGTDPIEGAAIAKAILMSLAKKGAKTVATTHYPELKVYALDTDRVENAACEFDVDTLRPTYRLIVGMPGSSNAFAISKKLGLNDEIIEVAKGELSDEDIHFEKLAKELEAERKKAEDERLAAVRMRSEIEANKKRYDNLQNELNIKQQKIIDDARQKANDIVNDARNRSAVLLNQLEEIKKELNAKNAAENLQNARNLYKKSIKDLEDNADPIENNIIGEKLKTPPKKGDTVVIASFGKEATVVDVNEKGKKAQVISGSMKMWVDFDDLRFKRAAKKKEIPKTRNVSGIKSRAEIEVKGEVDLRGMASDEAIHELDRYLDTAMRGGMTTVTIIHGKGTGVLRKAVHSFLKGHPSIKSYRLGVFGEGEMGVTIAELK